MKKHYTADKVRYKTMRNEELKSSFVLDDVFQLGTLTLTYSDIDRAIVGAAVPQDEALVLPVHKELAADYFCQRREVGVINIGQTGSVEVDGQRHAMNNRDSLYIGRGSQSVTFASDNPESPARFYFVSYPAHASFPCKHVPQSEAHELVLGEREASNERKIYQSIRPGIVESCQLVMGFTQLDSGSVWNTKPPHTHARRSEIYLYFDVPAEERVFHFMGEPSEIKSVILSNEQVAISPSWSIHSGAGTTNYSFIWAMGGENQEFTDMDHLALGELS